MKNWLDSVSVGLGECRTAAKSGHMSVRGLGSCVAIVLHDPERKIGGIAHVVLPSHTLARDQSMPAKFADTAVPHLLQELRDRGARDDGLVVRLIGGASMFAPLNPSSNVHMGTRNVAACRQAVAAAGLTVVGEDVGGETGRSLLFDVEEGTVTVRSLGQDVRYV
jgi:chemotaxis protein CheD